jgi:hypothetical protein
MLFIASIFSFILCVNVTVAAKIRSPALGIKFDSSSALPTLTLPYGTWRAFSYDSVNDVSFLASSSIVTRRHLLIIIQ